MTLRLLRGDERSTQRERIDEHEPFTLLALATFATEVMHLPMTQHACDRLRECVAVVVHDLVQELDFQGAPQALDAWEGAPRFRSPT